MCIARDRNSSWDESVMFIPHTFFKNVENFINRMGIEQKIPAPNSAPRKACDMKAKRILARCMACRCRNLRSSVCTHSVLGFHSLLDSTIEDDLDSFLVSGLLRAGVNPPASSLKNACRDFIVPGGVASAKCPWREPGIGDVAFLGVIGLYGANLSGVPLRERDECSRLPKRRGDSSRDGWTLWKLPYSPS